MVIVGGSSSRDYRGGNNFKRGVCGSCHSGKESVVRMRLLEAIRVVLLSSEGIDFVRQQVAERLGTAALDHGAEFLLRRDRSTRTENKIREFVGFLASGNHSTYVVQARDEKAAIEALEQEARVPIKLPTRCSHGSSTSRSASRWIHFVAARSFGATSETGRCAWSRSSMAPSWSAGSSCRWRF